MFGVYSEKFFMRVLFSKFHCPSFICFCKPSPNIYTSSPLKLENTPNVSPTHVAVHENSDQLPSETKAKEEIVDEKPQLAENHPKSNLRNPHLGSDSPKEREKKKVQWMDHLGKELVEIREFEASELDDTDNEGEDGRGCICVIL
ncbi:hypothetical protein UlMin_033615 [Ulmus minor]